MAAIYWTVLVAVICQVRGSIHPEVVNEIVGRSELKIVALLHCSTDEEAGELRSNL